MTLQCCKDQLEVAKRKGDAKQIEFWEKRIAHKLTLPKYAHLKEQPKEEKPKEKPKDGKTPKG